MPRRCFYSSRLQRLALNTFSFCAAGYLLLQPKCSAAGYNSSMLRLRREPDLVPHKKKNRKWLFEPKSKLYKILTLSLITKTGGTLRVLFLPFRQICHLLTALYFMSHRYTICHKTEVVKNTLDPVWQAFKIPVRALCNGDYDRYSGRQKGIPQT